MNRSNQSISNQPITPPMRPRPSAKRASPAQREPNAHGYLPPTMRSNSPLSGLLKNVVGGMDASAKIQESLALAYWPRAVGVQGAAATEVDTVRDGVLFVRTKSSVWSHELTLHKPKLLQNLNRMLGSNVIHDIIFRAQGITRQEKSVEVDTPGAEELAAVALEPEEKAELRVRLRQLISIPDDRIRHTIAVRLTNEAKLQHWRLERGWKLCLRCHVAHKTDADMCPQCRLSR